VTSGGLEYLNYLNYPGLNSWMTRNNLERVEAIQTGLSEKYQQVRTK